MNKITMHGRLVEPRNRIRDASDNGHAVLPRFLHCPRAGVAFVGAAGPATNNPCPGVRPRAAIRNKNAARRNAQAVNNTPHAATLTMNDHEAQGDCRSQPRGPPIVPKSKMHRQNNGIEHIVAISHVSTPTMRYIRQMPHAFICCSSEQFLLQGAPLAKKKVRRAPC